MHMKKKLPYNVNDDWYLELNLHCRHVLLQSFSFTNFLVLLIPHQITFLSGTYLLFIIVILQGHRVSIFSYLIQNLRIQPASPQK